MDEWMNSFAFFFLHQILKEVLFQFYQRNPKALGFGIGWEACELEVISLWKKYQQCDSSRCKTPLLHGFHWYWRGRIKQRWPALPTWRKYLLYLVPYLSLLEYTLPDAFGVTKMSITLKILKLSTSTSLCVTLCVSVYMFSAYACFCNRLLGKRWGYSREW